MRTQALLVSLTAAGVLLAVIGMAALPLGAVAGKRTGTDAIGSQKVTAAVPMDVKALVDAASSGCTNSPGPQITLSGELALGGLGVKLIFKNNAQGTHTHEEITEATAILIPEGESIEIPKQPVLGGTGGNPFIWLQFTDGDGYALSAEIFLGRCVQGLFEASADLVIPSLATAEVEGGDCDNTGSTISLSGELVLSGINARIIFRNNDNPVGGPHEADAATTVDVVILPEGTTIEFAKQPPLGGAGGNPWISLVFLNGDGEPASDEFLLGRCVQDF